VLSVKHAGGQQQFAGPRTQDLQMIISIAMSAYCHRGWGNSHRRILGCRARFGAAGLPSRLPAVLVRGEGPGEGPAEGTAAGWSAICCTNFRSCRVVVPLAVGDHRPEVARLPNLVSNGPLHVHRRRQWVNNLLWLLRLMLASCTVFMMVSKRTPVLIHTVMVNCSPNVGFSTSG